MSTEIDQNKKTVIGFYDLMFNQCKPKEAIDKYVGETYLQHNPAVADGKKAFIDYFIVSDPSHLFASGSLRS
jgi:predicted SnoaL-like aldol condensation-catalyzing enzyme